MGIFDKAKAMAAGNADKVNAIVDRVGDMVNKKTGGKHAAHVDKGQEFLRGQYGGQPEAPATEAPPANVPPTVPQAEAPLQERFAAPGDPLADPTGHPRDGAPAEEGTRPQENPPL